MQYIIICYMRSNKKKKKEGGYKLDVYIYFCISQKV
jgi:hypothetical protein